MTLGSFEVKRRQRSEPPAVSRKRKTRNRDL